MRISLDALLVLDSISRNGSFAAAGDELHRVPSAITYTIQKLEQDLDVKLFDRSGHRARLTEAGEALLREGRYLLRAATDLECRVKHVASGLGIRTSHRRGRPGADGAPVSAFEGFLPRRVRHARSPDDGSARRLLGCAGGGRADLVIGAPGDAPPQGLLAVEPMGSFEFVFVVAPDHALAACPIRFPPRTSCSTARYPPPTRRAICRPARRDCSTNRTP